MLVRFLSTFTVRLRNYFADLVKLLPDRALSFVAYDFLIHVNLLCGLLLIELRLATHRVKT